MCVSGNSNAARRANHFSGRTSAPTAPEMVGLPLLTYASAMGVKVNVDGVAVGVGVSVGVLDGVGV